MPGLNDELLHTLERLWSSSAQVGSDRAAAEIASFTLPALPETPTRSAERCSACHSHLPLAGHAPRDLARHVFILNFRDFMDPYTLNVQNVMKCCLEFLTPAGP